MNQFPVTGVNPVRTLGTFGQSVWLDDIKRSLIVSGELQRLIDEDGLCGVTSNSVIFEKAMTGSTDYQTVLQELDRRSNLNAKARYERLAIEDVQRAADVLEPVYTRTKRRDGYVSLEVSPHLARDTGGTLDEARRLWGAVGRNNLMIKVPATQEGIPAIAQLIGMGMNVNVTLLFAQETYELVAEAYLTGLEQLAERSGDVGMVASVASFFVSRIDTSVDTAIAARLKTSQSQSDRALLQSLLGTVAIANAKLAYQRYQRLFSGPRWEALANQGAMSQRVLWASTGTKNPVYGDVIYVEELIGPETVNAISPATLEAFRDHGRPQSRLTEGIDQAKAIMRSLEKAGLSVKEITDGLVKEGLQLFSDAFDKPLTTVEHHGKTGTPFIVTSYSSCLPSALAAAVQSSLKDWSEGNDVSRLWARDQPFWTEEDKGQWLRCPDSIEDQPTNFQQLDHLAAEVKEGGFSHALVLGMGGSSLCLEVMKMTFGKREGYPELLVLDSTDPDQMGAIERKINLATTLFIVSSKSGGTLETNILQQYFFGLVQRLVGTKEAGQRFIVIADPGSVLQPVAHEYHLQHLFVGPRRIAGQHYSALSNFNMVPAALMGVDVTKFLDRAKAMGLACASGVPAVENPGLVLGTILGLLATQGRDEVRIATSPGLAAFGAWLEQRIAQSTGKGGNRNIQFDREAVGTLGVYGVDGLFVYIGLDSEADKNQDDALAKLEREGQPVIRISVGDPYDLGQEFVRWEFATSVARSIFCLYPFNQPDEVGAQIVTKGFEFEHSGIFPQESPIAEDHGLKLYADPAYGEILATVAGQSPSFTSYLMAHLNQLGARDYFALLAYVEMNHAHDGRLQAIRYHVRDTMGVATCLGFGPRFRHVNQLGAESYFALLVYVAMNRAHDALLHSIRPRVPETTPDATRQSFGGRVPHHPGPADKSELNSGVFLQITCTDASFLPVSRQSYSFGILPAVSARGDFQVLAEGGCRVLRVDLGVNVAEGLTFLQSTIEQELR